MNRIKNRIQVRVLFFFIFLSFSVRGQCEILKLLADNKEAAQAKFDLIQQAQSEIRFEYFTVGPVRDRYTMQAFAALRQAAQRGVKVKILLDGGHVRINRAVIAALIETSQKNLEFRLFNMINPLRLSSISKRDHTKAMNIDNKILMTGDRNLSCQYFSDCETFHNHFKSVDMIVGGRVVEKAGEVFDQLWNNSEFVKSENLYEYAEDQRNSPCVLDGCDQIEQRQKAVAKEVQLAGLALDSALTDNHLIMDSQTNWLANGFEHNNVQLLFDDPKSPVSEKSRQMSEQIGKIITENVRPGSRLTILSPYLIPTPEVFKLFQDLLRQQVHIKIITNSLASTDNLFAQAGYSKYKLQLISMGIEIWEFNGVDENYRESLTSHAKCAVIDNRVGLIGSYNIDNRSQQINREMGIAVIDEEADTVNLNRPTFPKQLLHVIEDFQINSTLVGKDGMPTADVYKLEKNSQKLDALHAVAFLEKIFGLEGLL